MRNPQYSLKIRSQTGYGKEIYEFQSADGIESKNSFRDEELAIAEHLEPAEDDEILVAESGYGFLGAVLGDMTPEAETVLAETSDRAYQLSKQNMELNDIQNTECIKTGFYDEIDRSFDCIVYAPKAYQPVDFVKHRLENLVNLLEEGGQLIISGKKKTGFKRYRKHLAGFEGEVSKSGQEGDVKLYSYRKTSDFTPERTEIEKKYSAQVNDVQMSFITCEGLFSSGSLDQGTRVLLENLELPEKGSILDLASGYGTITAYMSGHSEGDHEFYLSDDSGPAVRYVEKNMEQNEVSDFHLEHADCLDCFKDESFDLIVSNPPTHQGRGITTEMFEQSYSHLNRKGRLVIVYNSNMNFEDQLKDIFGKVDILAEEKGFKVAEAQKS